MCFIGRSQELEGIVTIRAGSEGKGTSSGSDPAGHRPRLAEPGHEALSVVLKILAAVSSPATGDLKIRIPAHVPPQSRAIYTGGQAVGMGCTVWGRQVNFA